MAPNNDYRNFATDDLIKDEFFQRWVYFPDDASNAFWETFLSENPGKAEVVEDAADFLRLLNFTEEDVFESKIVALKNRIDFAVDHPEVPAKNLARERRVKHGIGHWLAIAATVTLVVTASFLLFNDYWKSDSQTVLSGVSEQSTSNGERTLLSLEDGTKIWLNVASKIQYPETFHGRASREVYLEGEAFFDVARNASQPFIVRTEGVQIKVLGTRFNVKSYHKEDQIQTTLVEGKVSIESIDEQPKIMMLAPNQMASYHKESKKLVLNNKTNMDALAGWKDGRLIFDNKPLNEIVLALERWYDVQIHVEDEESLKCHFSAKIENLSLTEVLDLFKASDGIDYAIEDSVVTIRGSICEN